MPATFTRIPCEPDFDSLARCIRRQGPCGRVHFVELYQDHQIKIAAAKALGVGQGLDVDHPIESLQFEIALQAALGYELIRLHTGETEFRTDFDWKPGARGETAASVQGYVVQEHEGCIQTWEDLEHYPWPHMSGVPTAKFDWCEKNLPANMKAYDLVMQVFEATTWLMGYESLFMNMLEEPELVAELVDRIGAVSLEYVEYLCSLDSVGVLFGCDDMGYQSRTMVDPDWLREHVLPWHKKAADIAHAHGKLYFLHSCGRVNAIVDDMIDFVGIDAKHSFEDAVTPVTEFYEKWGSRVGVLGGLDLDFLSRATPQEVRARTREVLDLCMPGGGYALGSGNSIASYVPLENYFAMLDEGRRWGL